MKNKLKGIIFFTKKIKDNDLYIKVLSSEDNIISGMVYGGNSSKKKLIYQNGYFIDFSIRKKTESSVAIFTADLSDPFLGEILDDKYKLNALLSILSIINISILEGQYIRGFFKAVEKLIYKIVNSKQWIVSYCEWLFELLRIIGYQIDYKNHNDKNFYDTSYQEFTYKNNKNTIVFPHNLFTKKKEINYTNLFLIFNIFEKIFTKNHLDNINYSMPINFLNFKNLILSKLKKN